MLELINIHTFYGESCALRGVSMKVSAGSVVALLGRNGMGKTTTIRSIIGFSPPRSGVINLKGTNIAGLHSHKIAQMGIGLVPQGRRIFPSLSVEENLTVGARKVQKPDAWTLEKIYNLFPILQKRSRVKGTLLSGGEQQMLAIGRALMTNSDLILMDEPSEGLAPAIVREITRIIVRLKKRGASILLVEQLLPTALAVADYIYIISSGEIVGGFTPEELRNNEKVQAKHLGLEK